jgi:hypothetical protein
LNSIIQATDYSHLIQNGDSEEMIDVHQQGAGTQLQMGGEASIPSEKGYP